MKHVIVPIFITHRGCPHQCVFCNQRAITARTGDVTPKDAEETINTWLSTVDRNTTEAEISFFGGSFTGIPMEEQTAFLKLAQRYKNEGRIDKIHCSTRPDYINREILDNLKLYGMDTIELGVQSFDNDVLKLSGRGHTDKEVFEACRLIKEYGFTLGIQLMIGLPGDSYESCMYSVRKTIEMAPQIARLYPTVVLPDTELYEMQQSGSYTPPSESEMLRTVKDMYRELTANHINVIRIGLKSNETVKSSNYHPAFGQLVKSAVALDEIEAQLAALKPEDGSTVIISAPQRLINFVYGHKGENRRILSEKYPALKFRFAADDGIEKILLRIVNAEC